VGDYPNPDLAIEVDISPSKVDRPGIYAALGVIEVWRFEDDHKRMVFERLREDGTYQAVDVSEFLPVHPDEVGR
jgi:Uma2 family endonuclease